MGRYGAPLGNTRMGYMQGTQLGEQFPTDSMVSMELEIAPYLNAAREKWVCVGWPCSRKAEPREADGRAAQGLG